MIRRKKKKTRKSSAQLKRTVDAMRLEVLDMRTFMRSYRSMVYRHNTELKDLIDEVRSFVRELDNNNLEHERIATSMRALAAKVDPSEENMKLLEKNVREIDGPWRSFPLSERIES